MQLRFIALFCIFGVIPVQAGQLVLNGEFVAGGLVVGQTEPNAKVVVDDQSVRVSEDGYFIFAFHRVTPAQTSIKVKYADGTVHEESRPVAKRKYKIQRIDGLPKNQVSPSAKELKRIRSENKQARTARDRDDARPDFRSGFVWPVIGPISGVYGSQRILNGQARRPHYGVDVARPTGTPVKAPADALITLAHPDMFYSGGTLIMDHGHGLSSSFLHLSKILVKQGDKVKQGDVVAEIGATGRVTGPHLDWRMNWFKKRIDPTLLVEPMPEYKAEAKKNGN